MISTVKAWDDKKGFGFITNPTNPRVDIFIHHSHIVGHGRKSLREGQRIEFEVETTDKGLKAVTAVAL